MTEQELLSAIHLGVLRDLARSVHAGTASHQTLAVARGILRDNKVLVPDGDEADEALPPKATPRKFPPHRNDE